MREKITLEQVAAVLWHQSCISISSLQLLLLFSAFQVTNTKKKKIFTNFIFPSQNSSFSELQGRLEEVEVQGKQGF